MNEKQALEHIARREKIYSEMREIFDLHERAYHSFGINEKAEDEFIRAFYAFGEKWARLPLKKPGVRAGPTRNVV